MRFEAKPAWPRNAWYVAACEDELRDGPIARTILNEDVVIFRGHNGEIGALEDRCCHRAAPLSMGKVTPAGLQCGYHGLIFALDGTCVSIPGQVTIPPQARVRSHPVVMRGDFVWIWMGEPQRADPKLLAHVPPPNGRPDGRLMQGVFAVKCNYMLLIDNLMDLTHVPFVHRSTIGGAGHGQMEVINAQVEIEHLDRGLRYIRWILGHTPPPLYIQALGLGHDDKVDRWQEFEYVAPGTVLQWTGGLKAGCGAQENREQEGGLSIRLYHAITPETENSCFHFWMRGNGPQPLCAATEAYYQSLPAIIAEDLTMLERQQARIAASPGRALVDIKNDNIRIMARRVLERLIRNEFNNQ